jgi:hypothetical protein
MENFIFHSLILFFDWRCITLLFAVQHYRTGTLSASSLRSAPGGSSPPLTDLFWSVRHSLRAMRKGAARPLTPGRVDNPAPVVSRFFYRLTPSGILPACVFMIFCAGLFLEYFFVDFAACNGIHLLCAKVNFIAPGAEFFIAPSSLSVPKGTCYIAPFLFV